MASVVFVERVDHGARIGRGRTMTVPKFIVFDVNETLLSLAPLKKSVGQLLGGREDLLPLWFSTMLHYSLVETLTDTYHSFGEIGTAALTMVAEAQSIQVEYAAAQRSIVSALRSLPPHSDVVAGLTALRADGRFKLVTLTNSSDEEADAKLRQTGLTDLFDASYTIESLKKYKPHPDAYRKVLRDLGAKPEEAMMVAAHAWDLAGAKNVGLQTAFIARTGPTLYPNIARPDYVVNNLQDLVVALKREPDAVSDSMAATVALG